MTQQSGAPVIQLRRVTKAYQTGTKTFTALDDINLNICRGEFTAVIGRSGSGKSTLINMITGIDVPSSGEVIVGETPIHQLNQERLAIWRGKNVGIVFQFFQLLPTLTVEENVMLPMDFCNTFPARSRR
jgi:putative ABC transport system ATP-binding protein